MPHDKFNYKLGAHFLTEVMSFVDCYIYYDGPRFYLVSDNDYGVFFVVWIEEEDEYDTWLLVSVDEVGVLMFLTKKADFCSVVEDSNKLLTVKQFYDERDFVVEDVGVDFASSCLGMHFEMPDNWKESKTYDFLNRDVVVASLGLFGGQLDSEGLTGTFLANFFGSTSKCFAAMGSAIESEDPIRFNNIHSGSLNFDVRLYNDSFENKVTLLSFLNAMKRGSLSSSRNGVGNYFTKIFNVLSSYGVGVRCDGLLIYPDKVKEIADSLAKRSQDITEGRVQFLGKLVTGSLRRGMLDVEVLRIDSDEAHILALSKDLSVKVPSSKRYFAKGKVLGGVYLLDCSFERVNGITSYELISIEGIYYAKGDTVVNGVTFPFISEDWVVYWAKVMTKTDAQQQTKGGPVPYLRLSQGLFSSDAVMNFQNWFRRNVFIGEWIPVVDSNAQKEYLNIKFKVFAFDVFLFETILKVSHAEMRSKYKPKGLDAEVDVSPEHNNPKTWIHFDDKMRLYLSINDMTGKLVLVARDINGIYSIRFYER